MIKLLAFLLLISLGHPAKKVDNNMQGLATHLGHTTRLVGASGIKYCPTSPYAAHRTIPFGAWIWVYNDDKCSLNYGKRVKVMVIDRGPGRPSACIDMEPHVLWQLAGKKVGGLKVKLVVADSSQTCNIYMCLKKKKN
jgi:rare lipoprotein A (peptidoglycan hydrolase)